MKNILQEKSEIMVSLLVLITCKETIYEILTKLGVLKYMNGDSRDNESTSLLRDSSLHSGWEGKNFSTFIPYMIGRVHLQERVTSLYIN